MKFTVPQPTIAAKLAQLVRLVPSRPSHPVLANILLVAKDDRIGLSVFDLSIGLQTWIEAEVAEPGSITIPAKLLSEIVSRLPNQDVTIETDELAVTIACGTGKYKMQGLSADEFPALPTIKADGVEVDCEAFRKALSQTLFAASTDESKQILTGVQIITGPDGMRFNATDGHRLVVYQDKTSFAESFSVVAPAKALRELFKMLQKGKSAIVKSDNVSAQISFEIESDNGTECLTCRVLEGVFPPVDQLLSNKFSRQLKVSRQEFLSAIERIAVLAALKNNIIKLKTGEETLLGRSLFLSADVEGSSGTEEIQCEFTGESIEIAFNVKYLSDGLKNIDCDAIAVNMNEPLQPIVIEPVNGNNWRYLVMPLQARS